MPRRTVCDLKGCNECAEVIARSYQELLKRGISARDVCGISVNLELRHPGHQRYYYIRCTERILEHMTFPSGIKFN